MKKRLLTLGALALAFSASAQFVSYVGNNSTVNVKTGALVYQGGGVKTVGTGKIDNSGNIMVVGTTASKFVTLAADNATPKTDGGNIIMRMTNDVIGSLRYGQLYIKGLTQNNITGIVDKEYKDVTHGTYQQVALPFFDKQFSTLSEELGKTFTNSRWTRNEILVYNNAEVKSDLVSLSAKTSKGTAYYMLGSKDFAAGAGKKTVKGIPYADGITENLLGAGAGIDFGTDGSKINSYREKYNTYVQDAWDYSNGAGAWKDNYGRNIYQFGNPYLTNLDLGQLTAITNLQGIRIEPQTVTTRGDGATYSASAKYINFTSRGIAVGDNNAIIRPMQTFVIKLNSNAGATLNFDDLRRFKYEPRQLGTNYGVNAMAVSDKGIGELSAMSSRSSRLGLSSSTVKQLGVIALNDKGEEIGRTYYVVYAEGVSGKPSGISTQATATSNNIIGTFEEAKEGGLDDDFKNAYWLYINEANENDFKGKEVPLRLYSEDIKALKFEIKENASEIKGGQEKLSSGESFYINLGDNIVAVNNGKSIPLSSTTAEFGLYYGKPSTSSLDNEIVPSVDVAKPSDTFIAFDTNDSNYKLIFDKTWKTANVQVYDISGRLILSQNNVNTANNFVINLPSGKGVYVVTAVSETGQKFSQKVVK